jgi:hypothetical protein
MGRLPGSRNKRTILREQSMRAASTAAALRLSSDTDVIAREDSLAIMEDAMTYFYKLALKERSKGEKANEDKVRTSIMDMAAIARDVLPHRHPKLASIHTSTSKQSALDRPGVTEREVFAEVMAEIVESGELPRSVRAYIERHSNGGVSSCGTN